MESGSSPNSSPLIWPRISSGSSTLHAVTVRRRGFPVARTISCACAAVSPRPRVRASALRGGGEDGFGLAPELLAVDLAEDLVGLLHAPRGEGGEVGVHGGADDLLRLRGGEPAPERAGVVADGVGDAGGGVGGRARRAGGNRGGGVHGVQQGLVCDADGE